MLRSVPIAAVLLTCLAGCAGTPVPESRIRFSADEPAEAITGLARCNDDTGGLIDIDPDAPLTLLVHGCRGSVGRFRALASVFELHEQQTLCYGYDDRDRIDDVAADLATTLHTLEQRMRSREITVIAHSQGGLIARRAFTEELPGAPETPFESQIRLVTVSSPFAGIRAARDCSKRWLHGLTLGITMAVCRGIAGRTWRDIHERSELVRAPGTLRPEVGSYLQLRTDERDTCRTPGENGECAQSDFVFSLDEQANDETVQAGTEVREVRAGHVEIVGDENVAPTILIDVLQEEEVLAATPPEREEALSELLRRLYGPARPSTVAEEGDASAPRF